MEKFINALNRLSADVQPKNMAIEPLAKDLHTLAEKSGIHAAKMPGLEGLKDLDGHPHEVLNHIGHIQTENSS